MSDRYEHWLAKRFLKWFGRPRDTIYGVTISSKTTLYSCKQGEVSPYLRIEEDRHKQQMKEDGIRFWFWYFRDLIWYGYDKAPYEKEAKGK